MFSPTPHKSKLSNGPFHSSKEGYYGSLQFYTDWFLLMTARQLWPLKQFNDSTDSLALGILIWPLILKRKKRFVSWRLMRCKGENEAVHLLLTCMYIHTLFLAYAILTFSLAGELLMHDHRIKTLLCVQWITFLPFLIQPTLLIIKNRLYKRQSGITIIVMITLSVSL